MSVKEEPLKEVVDCQEGIKSIDAIEKLLDIVQELGWDILIPNLRSDSDELPGLVIGDKAYVELVDSAVNEKLGALDIDKYLTRH